MALEVTGYEIVARAESSAAASMGEDDEANRVAGEAKDTLEGDIPLSNFNKIGRAHV